MPEAEVDKLAEGLATHPDVAVLSDEIYSEMLYDGRKHVSLLRFEALRDRVIMLDGWSKTYAMTGWRMGYARLAGSAGRACRRGSPSTATPASTPPPNTRARRAHRPAGRSVGR